jgi:hypothetical protein
MCIITIYNQNLHQDVRNTKQYDSLKPNNNHPLEWYPSTQVFTTRYLGHMSATATYFQARKEQASKQKGIQLQQLNTCRPAS